MVGRETAKLFTDHNPQFLLMIAAKAGEISANISNPTVFTTENLTIELNLFDACDKYGIEKFYSSDLHASIPRELIIG